MIFKSRHVALQTGYQIASDLPHGFTLCLIGRQGAQFTPQYRLIIHASWQLKPTIIWHDKHWRLNEAGMIGGLPLLRQKPLRWYERIAAIKWDHCFRVDHYSKNWGAVQS